MASCYLYAFGNAGAELRWDDALRGYMSDMIIAQAYALYNQTIIRDRIFAILKKLCRAKCVESIFTTHNYILVTDKLPMLRKGAIDASEGRKEAIPFNMRDGIAICIGKGNKQWLDTATHGVGRIMGRAQNGVTTIILNKATL